MADDYRFSYSISPPTSTEPSSSSPASSTNEDASLYAFTGCDLIDQGDDTTLVLNRDNGCEFLVQSPVATALTYCTTFQTLEQHAQMLANTLPPLQGRSFRPFSSRPSALDKGYRSLMWRRRKAGRLSRRAADLG